MADVDEACPVRHGAPGRDEIRQDQAMKLYTYIQMAEHQTVRQEYEAFGGYCFAAPDDLLNESCVRLLKSMAVSSILEQEDDKDQGDKGDFQSARLYLSISLKIEAALLLGLDAFFKEMVPAPNDDPNRTKSWQLQSYLEDCIQIGTKQGLILYLARNIPCPCLESKLQRSSENQVVSRLLCERCQKDESLSSTTTESSVVDNNNKNNNDQTHPPTSTDKRRLLKCGQCQEANYCSKNCQTLDWKDHKRTCAVISQCKGWLEKLGENLKE